jgi:hypothetical protein
MHRIVQVFGQPSKVVVLIVRFHMCTDTGRLGMIKEKKIYSREEKIDRKQRQFVEALDDITAKLHLPNLKQEVDSFELRVWCPMSAYWQDIIRIRYIDSYWDFSQMSVWMSYPDWEIDRYDTVNHLMEVVIESTRSKTIVPNEKVADSILNRFIIHFPKHADLEGSFTIGMDSYRYIFEIAKKDSYQMLDYDCGGDIIDKEELHHKINELINFLRRQLNGEIPACN